MPIDRRIFLDVVRSALQAGDAQLLARRVSELWQVGEICPLLADPDVDIRRVAAVVLGFVGDVSVVGCLAKALHDIDEQVNEMAQHGLWSIWFRAGSPQAVKPFRQGVAMLGSEQYPPAVEHFLDTKRIDPDFAEAYNQCAIAHFFMGNWEAAIEDCKRTIERMPVHFGAASGMGHCYTQLGDLRRAQQCYTHALKINPRMPAIVSACDSIREVLRGLNDSSGIFQIGRATA